MHGGHDMHLTDRARDGGFKSVSGAAQSALVTLEGLHSESNTAHSAPPSAMAARVPALQKPALLTVLTPGPSRSPEQMSHLAADEGVGIGSCCNGKLADQCGRLAHLPPADAGARGLWGLLDLCSHHCLRDCVGLRTAARDERCGMRALCNLGLSTSGSKGSVIS